MPNNYRLVSAAVVSCTAAILFVGSPATAAPMINPLAAPSVCTEPGAHGFGSTFVDPYWLRGKTRAQMDALLKAQKSEGIDTVILQWTAYRSTSGAVSTTYPADPALGFGRFDTSGPVFLQAAKDAGVTVWAGLMVAPKVFEDGQSAAVLDALESDTLALAADLASKYADLIDGWYLPIEPGKSSVASIEDSKTFGDWLGRITTGLHDIAPLPTMTSPAVPTMKIAPSAFAAAFEPVMERAGIDVWNIQDGYGWTGWTPSQNAALIADAQAVAAKYDAAVWADIYTPFGADGAPTVVPENLQADLKAVGATGVPITVYQFSRAFNPDPSITGFEKRVAQLDAYNVYCFGG